MSLAIEVTVRFGHVDAAGIVFYPRYFEMLNAALEEWFAKVTGVDFAALHLRRGIGVPTVTIAADFAAPSRLGDRLAIDVVATGLGRTSCRLRFDVDCAGQGRMRATSTIVCIDLKTGAPIPWPDDIRPGLLLARGAEGADQAG